MAQDTSEQSSHGKVRRAFRAGDAVGTPLEQWAYYTPRSTTGISVSDLRVASSEVQRETALIWFYSNFKRYELGSGPYFGFAEARRSTPFSDGSRFSDGSGFAEPAGPTIAGFNQAPFAPVAVRARAALDAEYASVLGDDVRRAVAEELPGDWMRSRSDPPPRDPQGETQSRSDLAAAILVRLDLLQQAIDELGPIRGGIGHNRPPNGAPLTAQEQRELRALIDRASAAVASDGASHSNAVAASAPLRALEVKLGAWLLGQVNTFVTEANKAVAKESGKLIWAAIAWACSKELIELLQQLKPFLQH